MVSGRDYCGERKPRGTDALLASALSPRPRCRTSSLSLCLLERPLTWAPKRWRCPGRSRGLVLGGGHRPFLASSTVSSKGEVGRTPLLTLPCWPGQPSPPGSGPALWHPLRWASTRLVTWRCQQQLPEGRGSGPGRELVLRAQGLDSSLLGLPKAGGSVLGGQSGGSVDPQETSVVSARWSSGVGGTSGLDPRAQQGLLLSTAHGSGLHCCLAVQSLGFLSPVSGAPGCH